MNLCILCTELADLKLVDLSCVQPNSFFERFSDRSLRVMLSWVKDARSDFQTSQGCSKKPASVVLEASEPLEKLLGRLEASWSALGERAEASWSAHGGVLKPLGTHLEAC